MADSDELDTLPSSELHDRAIKRAEHHLDVGFLWRLLEAIPAAEAGIGDTPRAEDDVSSLRTRIQDLMHADEGDLADALRPLYLEYLREHA